MDFQKGFNRDQLMMVDFKSMVLAESWARIVDLFVEIQSLKELDFEDVLIKEGRPPFHSSGLLKLYLYGYKNEIRSSRKLAHACKVNLQMICYNLRRLMSIFGENALKKKLKSLDLYVLMLYKANKAIFEGSNKNLYYIY